MKKLNAAILLGIFLLLFSINTLKGQEVLEQYLIQAAENNPGVKASFSEYMAALEQVSQAGSLPDPQLAFAYFIQPVETRNGPQQFKISLSQLFPWFGTLKSQKEVVENKAKAKYEVFQETKAKLYFDVKSSYYSLYFLKKSIDVTLENIEILQTFKNLALIKVETGTASAVDGLRAEMEVADLENNLAYLKDKFNTQQVKFYNLLNTNVDNEVILPDSLWKNDLKLSKEAVLDSIEQKNHQVLKIDFLKASFKSKERQAKQSGLPKISIGIDYIGIGDLEASENSGKDAILFPKIGISIPIYRKKYKAMVAEAVFMQESTENNKADKINLLETLLEQSYSNYLDANRRIVLNRKQLNMAQQAINILESGYAASGKNFEEILRMEKRKLSYALEYQKALADKQAEIGFIEYLIGKN